MLKVDVIRAGQAASRCVATVVLLGPAAGCTRPLETTSHGGPVRDHVSFVDHLRASGFTVMVAGKAEQPFLRAEEGTLIRIGGRNLAQPVEVQSYQYADARAAQGDADGIGPDGNPRTMQIEWVGPPHFYRRERLIVLYVGGDAAAIELLSAVLGPQFAGK